MLQLSASLDRIALEKRRNIRISVIECCSHLLIIGILLGGYGLSIVKFYPAKVYDSYEIRIPPFSDFNGVLNDVNRILQGPVPVPSLDSFVLASKFVSSQVKNDGVLMTLVDSSSLGQAYGNLVQFGDLHLAPYPSPEVDSFVSYLNEVAIMLFFVLVGSHVDCIQTMASFSLLTIYNHSTEEDAVNYIVDHLDRWTLALIVFREVTPQKVNYVIRQNYTTLPGTDYVVNTYPSGLDTTYQKYYLSGFLSIQSAIEEWSMSYVGATTTRPECANVPQATSMPFPTYEYNRNPFYTSVGFLLGVAFTSKCILTKIQLFCYDL